MWNNLDHIDLWACLWRTVSVVNVGRPSPLWAVGSAIPLAGGPGSSRELYYVAENKEASKGLWACPMSS